jgi:hypothetical protein
MPAYDINDDIDLKEKVRTLTGYEDSADELPDNQLDTLIESMKLKLSVQYESTDWYNDDAFSLVLLGVTCIYAKSQVENYSVESYEIGDESITVRDSDPEDSLQLQQWADLVNTGTKNSSVTDTDRSATMSNTSEYIG